MVVLYFCEFSDSEMIDSVVHVVGNLFSRYLGAGEVTPGVLGDSHHGEVMSDMTTGFVALCAIYFPSVTGRDRPKMIF